jgi:O-antigen/teichoic acid export membrane protein
MSVREVVQSRLLPASHAGREQMLATAGQLAAGASNLVFALIVVRILPRAAYADLAAFLALYMLVGVFAGSLGAGTALSPLSVAVMRPRLWKFGCGAALIVVAASEPIASLVGLAPGLVIALGVALPATSVLAVERGALYGTRRFRPLIASLLAEPAVRLTIGLGLALFSGARGAATGVAAAGWVALALAAPYHLGERWSAFCGRVLQLDDASLLAGSTDGAETDASARTRSAVITFLLLAVLMNQDILWANRLLPTEEAGRFAVLSTLGGLAAFATSTVPLVLLGQRDRPDAFHSALRWAAMLGVGAVAFIAGAPRLIVTLGFGSGYADVAPLAVPYVIAMALLGIARVFAARLCASDGGRIAAWCVGAAVTFHAVLIATGAKTPGSIAGATLISTAAAAAALGTLVALRTIERPVPVRENGPPSPTPASSPASDLVPAPPPATDVPRPPRPPVLDEWRGHWRSWASDTTVRWTAVLTGLGLALRLFATRSVWLDEAIAVSQARLGFGEMLDALRYADVHPPLHSVLLWMTTRVMGTSELAIRLPSMIAGAAMIPLLYAVGRDLYDRRTGLIAAAFATIAPFLVWYSQEARMYALFMLFGVAAVWAQIRVLRGDRRSDWALYALATALMVWTHYFALLQIAVQQVIFVLAAWRRRRGDRSSLLLLRRWVLATSVIAIALLPLVAILRDQLVAYENRGAPLQGVPARAGGELDPQQQQLSLYAMIANLIWAVWGYHSDVTMARIVALWPLGLLFILFLLGRRRSWTSSIAVAVFAVPMVLLFAAGMQKRDLFELRYFVVAAPLLLLLAARVITAGVRRTSIQIAAAALVAFTLAVGVVDQQTNGANPRVYDFRGGLERISRMARPSDIVVYAPFYLEPVMDYYAPRLDAQKLTAKVPEPKDGQRLMLLASFLDKKNVSGQVGGALAKLRENHELERELRLPRVKVWVFR